MKQLPERRQQLRLYSAHSWRSQGDHGRDRATAKMEHIDLCPLCLRDTMLAVAALLHLEATTVADAKSGGSRHWG